MQLTIKTNFKGLVQQLDALEKKQLRYAMARALTDTAKEMQKGVRSELPSIFDRPAPFTMNSLAIVPATKETLSATLAVKDLQARYLAIEQFGGMRTPAENTRNAAAKAIVLPGPTMPKDRFGGIPAGKLAQLRQAADQMKAARLAAHRGKTPRAQRRAQGSPGRPKPAWPRDFGVFYWKAPNGRWAGGGGGYFIRQPGHFLKRLTAFKDGTHYNPRFDFFGRSGKVAQSSFEANWRRWIKEAVATAKP